MQTYLVDIDDTVYSRTYQLDDDLKNLNNITVFEGVHELCSLKPTVFVSKGDPLLQMKKLILGLLSRRTAYILFQLTRVNWQLLICTRIQLL